MKKDIIHTTQNGSGKKISETLYTPPILIGIVATIQSVKRSQANKPR